jgi:hypothetical protein
MCVCALVSMSVFAELSSWCGHTCVLCLVYSFSQCSIHVCLSSHHSSLTVFSRVILLCLY